MLFGVDLREVYDALDQDSDGLVTVTDVEVLCLRITGTRIKSEDLHQLWWRMGAKSSSQMLDYQRFMYEMIPRTKEPLRPSSN